MLYRINEIFYSLQGEGRWTGVPMVFIRLSGCNLACSFCDTPDKESKQFTELALLERIKEYPTNRVCITGGEPLIQNLDSLIRVLKDSQFKVHLETNGTLPLPDTLPDWTCVSPKTMNPVESTVIRAQEIKYLCGIDRWWDIIRVTESRRIRESVHRYLMPLADGQKPIDRWQQEAMAYCLGNPRFTYCHQLHKTLNIK